MMMLGDSLILSSQISICFSYKIVMDLIYLIRVLKCLSLITTENNTGRGVVILCIAMKMMEYEQLSEKDCGA